MKKQEKKNKIKKLTERRNNHYNNKNIKRVSL